MIDVLKLMIDYGLRLGIIGLVMWFFLFHTTDTFIFF